MLTCGERLPARRWFVIFLAAAAASLALHGVACAQDRCVSPPPVERVEAAAVYSDPAGSKLDLSALRRNQQLIQPLRAFTSALTREVDGEGQETTETAARRCAATMLDDWAAARALLQQPESFPAIRERQRFGLGITLAALKLRALGGRLDSAALEWLDMLDGAVVQDFARRRTIDNLEIWSAANAAALAIADRNQQALGYEAEVWRDGIDQIGSDGFVASELRRMTRALLYHQYYASALLFLRDLRRALGEPVSAGDEAALRRLVERVEASLCDPAAMASAAGGYPQEPTPAAQFAVGLVFGRDMIDERWTRCGTKPADRRDETLGGQLDRTLALLPRAAAAPP
jgi:poly(beta-D-mannuronate) lyase